MANGPQSESERAAWRSFRWTDLGRQYRHLLHRVPPPLNKAGSSAAPLKSDSDRTKETIDLLEKARDLITAIAVPQQTKNKATLKPFFPDGKVPRTHPDFDEIDETRDAMIEKIWNSSSVWKKLRALFFEWAGPALEHAYCDESDSEGEFPFSKPIDELYASINDKKWAQAQLVIQQLAYPLSIFNCVTHDLAHDFAFVDALCVAGIKGNKIIAQQKYLEDSKCSDKDLERAATELTQVLSLLDSILVDETGSFWIDHVFESEGESPLMPLLNVSYKFERVLRKIGFERSAEAIDRYVKKISYAVFEEGWNEECYQGKEETPSTVKKVKACASCGLESSQKNPLRKCSGGFIDSEVL